MRASCVPLRVLPATLLAVVLVSVITGYSLPAKGSPASLSSGDFGSCQALPQGWSCGNSLGLNGTIATVSNGVLLTDLFANGVGNDNNYQYATTQKGTFPWSPCQAPASGVVPSDLSNVSATFLPSVLPTSGRYHIYLALYYWLPNGPVASGVSSYRCLDTQVRVEFIGGAFSGVGTTATYDTRDSFGWENVSIGLVVVGQSYTLTADVANQCHGDLAAWGIPLSTTCQLAGIEIGAEGFQFQELNVEWPSVLLSTATSAPQVQGWCTPQVADLNGDHVVNILDVSIAAFQYGQTGAGMAGDIDHDGRVDIIDVACMAFLYGAVW